ncbi:unnamed protein product [Blepharisma stoltei]|uniref:tRNA-intron lyase n=1 Tax=Blepharisma stoltei TaxID=1481888 RepID=A0AAU9KBJ9_9CILI|nr:unnamed protein product [Blepharisma stoltei]
MDSLKDVVRADLERRGWEVKDGILYGGDFLLYKGSTEGHTHAEFIVKLYEKLPTYQEILGSVRVATQVKKVYFT